MSSTLIAPENEIFPNRYRWTKEACYRLMDLGVLEGRYELLDGEIIDKMGQKPPHSASLTRLARIFAAIFRLDQIRVQSPISLHLPDGIYNEPEPDVAVTREAVDAYGDRHPGPEDLMLVVEVSDTTLQTDLALKARLYARSEIPEYWALNLPARQAHVYREPANGEYTVVTIHTETETVALAARPDAPVAVSDLLPPAA